METCHSSNANAKLRSVHGEESRSVDRRIIEKLVLSNCMKETGVNPTLDIEGKTSDLFYCLFHVRGF